MSNLLHVALYNLQPQSSQELRGQIAAVSFVRFVQEVDSADHLAALLQEQELNLIFFHLDPDPAAVIDVIDQVSTRYPSIALIAVSHQTAPDAILAPMRAGCDQFVCEPINPDDLAAAVSRVARRRLLHHAKSQCICVTGASGGMGATSIACNLALELGQLTNATCALLDLNLQFGDAALNFDVEPKYTLFDIAGSVHEMDRTVLNEAVTSLPCNVALLSRPEAIEQSTAITADVVHRVVELLNASYANVVVDLPHRLDECILAALGQADVILLVCQLMIPSIRNTKRYYDALLNLGIPDDRIRVVVNRTTKSAGRISESAAEDTVRKPIFARVPNDYEFVARSLDFGRPIAALDRDNPVRKAIREMAHKLANVAPEADAAEAPRKGLLGRLLSK